METFCQTVQFYLKHLEDSVYPVMTEDQFALKLFPMYRYFVTVWLRNHNPEVKLGVIKSLKPMLSLLLPNDDLREQVYDYIPLLLAEYQGSLEALFITQVLRQILEVSVTTSTLVPQMQLHTIFTELHVQVCTKAPAWQQYSGQNLTEVVHCFIALDVDEQGGRPRGDADPDQGSGERRWQELKQHLLIKAPPAGSTQPCMLMTRSTWVASVQPFNWVPLCNARTGQLYMKDLL
ncbi:maestro heat-like repeat-containing protein family member 2A isoform X1 [Pteropus vampyrus]|uniref:Maestro heat-like repeat-containing protein family member 2A isoform X1 n=1 Tax=Pteropus vampyrus TaxID=132908 RepID=A0A6P6C6V9_PTEVA|nr:maestro heat-like repeat-containing protein family member 2A isoform X1 [Pteropus vampyrus]